MTRRDLALWGVLIILSTLLISGFVSAAARIERDSWARAQPCLDQARARLAEQLGIPADHIRVQSVTAIEFPDSSLGVPEPDKFYLTVVTPGYVIKLVAEGMVYEYHAGAGRVVQAS